MSFPSFRRSGRYRIISRAFLSLIPPSTRKIDISGNATTAFSGRIQISSFSGSNLLDPDGSFGTSRKNTSESEKWKKREYIYGAG